MSESEVTGELSMDKSWLKKGRCSIEYVQGCKDFLRFAAKHCTSPYNKIYCPCKKCHNMLLMTISEVESHLLFGKGFKRSYVRWTKLGEDEEVNSNETLLDSNATGNMHERSNDALRIPSVVVKDHKEPQEPSLDEPPTKRSKDALGIPSAVVKDHKEPQQPSMDEPPSNKTTSGDHIPDEQVDESIGEA